MTEFTPISFRKGFATNSSSSHAIIISNDSKFPQYDDYSGDFGWDWFVQQTFESKLAYIYVALRNNFDDFESLAEHLDVTVEQIESVDKRIGAGEGYIDHDSINLINQHNAKIVLHSPMLAIRGGNDNSEVPTEFQSYQEMCSEHLSIAQDVYQKFIDSGEDALSLSHRNFRIAVNEKVVSIFNTETGEKTRFSTIGNNEVYLSFPELVDIKITDYCPYGCDYCYQDSTVDGQHADIEALKAMADFLSKKGTFELAIGGGEPTLHPNFEEFVQYVSNDTNMVINYTTRNLTYFKKSVDELDQHLSSIGGFAYSIDEKSDIDRFEKLVDYWIDVMNNELNRGKINSKYGFENRTKFKKLKNTVMMLVDKVSFQLVLGVLTRDEYVDLVKHLEKMVDSLNSKLKEVELSFKSWRTIIGEHGDVYPAGYWFFNGIDSTLMLLGYKTTGRGSSAVYDYGDDALSDISFIFEKLNIGIDTSAAQHLTTEINKFDIDERTYYVKEGVASCYIDAVANTMADSSYGTMIDLNKMDEYSVDTFKDVFNTYQRKALNAISVLSV